MSTETPNLHLVKPAGTEPASIAVINANMDIIDEWAGADPINRTAPTLNGLGTWEISQVFSARMGGVCMISFNVTTTAPVGSGNIANQEIVVLPVGWRPAVQTVWVAGDYGCIGRLLTTGQVNINNGGTGVPDNGSFNIALMYLLDD